MSSNRLAHSPVPAILAALLLAAALAGCGGGDRIPDGSVPGELTLPRRSSSSATPNAANPCRA